MKFITKKPVELENKEEQIKITVSPATNEKRFTLYEYSTDDSLAGRIKMAEFLFLNCVDKLSIKGQDIDPADMIQADLSDEETANAYFTCVNMVTLCLMGVDEDGKDDVKK